MRSSFYLILALFSYFFIDKDLAILLNEYIHPNNLFKIFSFLISPLNQLIFWSFLTLCALHPLYRVYLKSIFTLLLTTLIYMFIAGSVKIIIGRARPSFFLETGFHGFSFFEGYHSYFRSFPSSHAASAFACTYFFTDKKKPIFKTAMYLLAALLVSSRLFLKEHYLSDVILGSMIGIFSAKLALYLVINKTEQAFKLARFYLKRP